MRTSVIVLLVMFGCSVEAPEPTQVTLHVGGGIAGSGPNYDVTLMNSGELTVRRSGLPIVPPGKLTEASQAVTLDRAEAAEILRAAARASDFSEGCSGVADGTVATLVLELPTGQQKFRCDNAGTWPVGPHTKALLQRINARLPEAFKVK